MEKVGCERIEILGAKSLRTVSLIYMLSLERWSTQEVEMDNDEQVIFHCLKKLCIEKCPRMVCLPYLLPSLKTVTIHGISEMLLRSVANYTSLASLSIRGFSEVMFLPGGFGPSHINLHTLEIRDCPKLTSLSNQLKKLLSL